MRNRRTPAPRRRAIDLVNHPPHYTVHPSGVECITIVEHMPFNIGNAVKYLWRAGHKGDVLEDLRKAEFYVKREIQRMTTIKNRVSRDRR